MKHNFTPRQLELFIFFTMNYGCNVSCEEILDAVWCGIGSKGLVRKEIYYLRQKLPFKMVIRNVSTNRYMMDSL